MRENKSGLRPTESDNVLVKQLLCTKTSQITFHYGSCNCTLCRHPDARYSQRQLRAVGAMNYQNIRHWRFDRTAERVPLASSPRPPNCFVYFHAPSFIYPSNIALYPLHRAFANLAAFVGQLATARRELICEETV